MTNIFFFFFIIIFFSLSLSLILTYEKVEIIIMENDEKTHVVMLFQLRRSICLFISWMLVVVAFWDVGCCGWWRLPSLWLEEDRATAAVTSMIAYQIDSINKWNDSFQSLFDIRSIDNSMRKIFSTLLRSVDSLYTITTTTKRRKMCLFLDGKHVTERRDLCVCVYTSKKGNWRSLVILFILCVGQMIVKSSGDDVLKCRVYKRGRTA